MKWAFGALVWPGAGFSPDAEALPHVRRNGIVVLDAGRAPVGGAQHKCQAPLRFAEGTLHHAISQRALLRPLMRTYSRWNIRKEERTLD